MKTAVKNFWNQHTAFGQLFLVIGLAALVVDFGMSATFGLAMSKWHALGFMVVALLLAVLPDAAYREWENRRKGSGAVLALACVPLFAVAYFTHIGYTIGRRAIEADTSSVANVKYEDTRASIEDAKRNLTMAENRYAELTAGNKGWATTVTASQLRTQLDTAQKAIDLEAARKGCKAKCLALMQEKSTIEGRIAVLEEINKNAEMIKSNKAWLATARDAAKTSVRTVSETGSQTEWVSSIYKASLGADVSDTLNPDAQTQKFVGIFIGLAVAFAGMIAAPIGLFVAGRNRMAHDVAVARSHMVSTPSPTASVPTVNGEKHTHEVIMMQDRDPRLDDVQAQLARLRAWAVKPAVAA